MNIFHHFLFYFYTSSHIFSDRKKERTPGCPPPTKPKPTRNRKANNLSEQQPVEVYARLRPSNDSTVALEVRSETQIQLVANITGSNQIYHFKRVFNHHDTQKFVFEEIAFPLINSLVNGENG